MTAKQIIVWRRWEVYFIRNVDESSQTGSLFNVISCLELIKGPADIDAQKVVGACSYCGTPNPMFADTSLARLA